MEETDAITELDDHAPVVKKSNKVDASGDSNGEADGKISVPQETQLRVMEKVQQLMQELEDKREADKQLVGEFRSRLHEMVDQLCQQVEERILFKHQETNKQMEVKLQYLNEVVGRVCELEAELSSIKNAIGCLYKGLNN